MIAPEFRACENMALLAPARTFISANYGDQLWNDLQHDLEMVEQTHNQLSHVNTHKTNEPQLAKFQDLFLK